jgi:hypothetical protein
VTSDLCPDDGSGRGEEAALAVLAERFALGDLNPKRYARLRQQVLAALGRSKIAPSLEPGETITAEHHWVESHARLPDAPFAETGQTAGSLYATDRRLFRWRFHDGGSPSASPPEDVEETIESLWYAEIAGMERRSSFRWGEAITGLVIAAAAGLMYTRLGVTGPLLLAVGVFGVVHAIVIPTRYVTVVVDGADTGWPVWAARTKSGQAVLGEVAKRLAPSVQAAKGFSSEGDRARGGHVQRRP